MTNRPGRLARGFVIRHWSLVIGHWALVVAHWSVVVGHWSFVICHLSFSRNYRPCREGIRLSNLVGKTGGRTDSIPQPNKNSAAAPQIRPLHGPMPQRV